MRVFVFYAVWGEKYIERFLSYALPTQMSPENLFALPKGSVIKIATRESDVDRFNQSPVIVECRKTIDVEIVAFSDLMFERENADKYSILLHLQNYALGLSANFDAIIFGYADALWAEGSYKNALKRLDEGYDLVMCVGFNVIEQAVIDLIDREYAGRAITQRDIAPRRFAKIIYNNLHVVAQSRFWDHPYINNYPSFLLWNVEGKGIVARAFHLHPVIIRVRHDDSGFFSPFTVTLDEELVPRLIRMGAVPYISLCSDEMSVCGLLGEVVESHLYFYPLRPPNIYDVVIFAERSASLHHREFFQSPIRLVCDDSGDEDWYRAEREAERVCSEVTRRLFLADQMVKHETPLAFAARRERATRFANTGRNPFVLTKSYIKNARTPHLEEILKHYFDSRGAKLFSFFNMAPRWPRFRQILRRTKGKLLRRHRSDARVSEPQQEPAEEKRPLNLNYILTYINFSGILLVAYELVLRRRRL